MTMTPTIAPLPEEELSRYLFPNDEPGFGALSTERGPLPLKALDVLARIDGLLAEVAVTQTFVNTHAEPLEATYIFPLPDRAAVTEFRLEVAGRIVEGVLNERGAARREYDRAIQAGHRAAISEEERPGVFTLRVGNLPPGEAATVHFRLSGPLAYDSGEVTFRFPLVVAPRYIPGTPLPGPAVGSGTASDTDAVPDASRISPPVLLPGFPSPVRLSLAVEVAVAGLAPRDFRCSLHAALLETEGGVARVCLQPGERLDRDFVLRYRLGGERVGSSLALLPDKPGAQEGTFALTLLPPLAPGRGARPRDVVFVLDRSGSMGGWKMVAARRALARMADTLTGADRFAVYAFDDRVETVPQFGGPGLAQATDRNRFRAVEFLAKVDARGGTEMAQPLDLAVQQLTSEGEMPGGTRRDRVLVLITDGQVGNEDQILRQLGKRLAGLRVFTLGIDQAVNEGFLRRLATLGGGFCEVVESEDRLDDVMQRLHSRIGAPVLTGLKLEERGFRLDPQATVPSRLPDLFAGAALLVLGRYWGAPEGALTVSGQDAAGRRWGEAVSGRLSCSPAVQKAWARARVRELEDRFVTGQADPRELEGEIVGVSLRFGVLCRFTAFVAVDRAEVVNEGGSQHRIIQPVEAPAGWETGADDFGAVTMTAALGAPMPASPAPCAAPPPTHGVPKRAMLAKQVLQELNADGRVSKKTELACDDTARDAAQAPLEPASPPPSGTVPPPPAAPPTSPPRGGAAWSGFKKGSKARSRKAPPMAPRATPGAPKDEEAAPGLLSKFFGLFRRAKQEPAAGEDAAKESAPVSPGLDLSAYRRRAVDLLEQLRSGSGLSTAQRLHELGVIAVGLKALLEDLASVGASPLELRPLQTLHEELTKLLEQPSPDEATVARLWGQAEEVLRVFSGEPAAPAANPAEGRREFWK
jgi:Ca-activated chloride channel homolog